MQENQNEAYGGILGNYSRFCRPKTPFILGVAICLCLATGFPGTSPGLHALSVALVNSSSADCNPLTLNIISQVYDSFIQDLAAKGEIIRNTYGLSADDVEFHEGSFTRSGAREALVTIYDSTNYSHAQGYEHVFVLKCEDGWEIDRHWSAGDSTSTQTVVDIEGDGKLEIWLVSTGGNQGYFESVGRLVSLDSGGNEVVLFQNQGHDYTGGIMPDFKGEAFRGHEVSFSDQNGDGVLEVIDKETIKAYTGYEETSSRTTSFIYKLVNGHFQLAGEESAGPKATSALRGKSALPAREAGKAAEDTVRFAVSEIERTKTLWTPVFYSSVQNDFKVSERITESNEGGMLLEAPRMAVDLGRGGLLGDPEEIYLGGLPALDFVDSLSGDPKAVCKGLCKTIMEKGWEEYKNSFEIVKRYRQNKTMTRADAVSFIRDRLGATRVGLGRGLYEGALTESFTAGKNSQSAREALERLWQGQGGSALTTMAAAEFVRDAVAELEKLKAGLMVFPPYLKFLAKSEELARRRLEDALRFAGPAASEQPDLSGAKEPEAEVEEFDEFFRRFRSDEAFQLSRIKFPLKFEIENDPENDKDNVISYSQKDEWKFEAFKDGDGFYWQKGWNDEDECSMIHQKEGTGISTAYCFRKLEGKWYMTEIVDTSM